jgi:hypothetical protein
LAKGVLAKSPQLEGPAEESNSSES